jgi:hypothetical protein
MPRERESRTSVTTLIDDLETTRDETLRYFSLDSADLQRTYAPGKWTIAYVLHHLADAETVMFERIRRTISEDRPALSVFDPDQWAAGLNYAHVPLELSHSVFQSVRNLAIHYVARFYESHGDRVFVHSVAGVRTLREEMEKVAAHNAHHLGQIRQALRE